MQSRDHISAFIVDDESPARRRLQTLIGRHADVELVGTASDGASAVTRITALCPQILFLDVEMPHMDGFEVLRALPPAVAPVTVLATAFDRYAVAAFDVQAIDYLLKPFSDERFDAALGRAIRAVETTSGAERRRQIDSLVGDSSSETGTSGYLDRIAVKQGARVTLVDVSELDWISAAGVYLELHAGSTTYLYRASLTSLMGQLDPSCFLRVHRSVAINTSRIKELRPRGHSDYTVILRDGRTIPLSRTYRADLEAWLRQPL